MKKPLGMALGLTIIVVGSGFLLYMTIGPGGREPAPMRKLPDERTLARQLLQKWDGLDAVARKAAVPTLVKALKLDDEEIRRGVVRALEKAGAAASADLMDAVQDGDARVRYYAVWALGQIGAAAHEAAPTLLAKVKDNNGDVRRKVIWALPRLQAQPEAAIPLLVAALTDRNNDVRVQAADSLAAFGAAAVPPLLEKLQDSRQEQRRLATRAIGQIGTAAQKAIPLLRAQLLDPDSGIQEDAARALAQFGKAAIPVLVEAIHGDDAFLRDRLLIGFGSVWALAALWRDPSVQRRQAINALGTIGPDARNVLLDALQDRHSDVREQVAAVLGNLGLRDPHIVLPLAERLSDPSDSVRVQAAWALQTLAPEPRLLLPELRKALTARNAAVRLHAVTFLGSLGAPALPLLLDALKDKDATVQRQTVVALQKIDVDNAALVRAVTPLLDSTAAPLRQYAVSVLHRCGTLALPHLVRALRDSSPAVREQVVLAFQDVGADDQELQRALLTALQDQDAFVRAGTLAALTRFGTKSLPQFEVGIKDQGPQVRRVAAAALGRFGGLKAAPLLIEALRDSDDKVWAEAHKALADMPLSPTDSKKLLALLAPALKDKTKAVRQGATLALKRFGAEAVPYLLAALKDPDKEVNYAAAFALDDIGTPARKAIPELVETALSHPEPKVKEMALKALLKMHDLDSFYKTPADAVPGLIGQLEAQAATTRWAAALTLGVLGPTAKDAVPALTKVLKDSSPSVRQAAQYALECIQVKDR